VRPHADLQRRAVCVHDLTLLDHAPLVLLLLLLAAARAAARRAVRAGAPGAGRHDRLRRLPRRAAAAVAAAAGRGRGRRRRGRRQRGRHQDVKLAALDDKEVVADVALADDDLAGLPGGGGWAVGGGGGGREGAWHECGVGCRPGGC
jgi:hypothetical protein